MWTTATRAQHAGVCRDYLSSLTDWKWDLLRPLLPTTAATGRPWHCPLRSLLDAMLYVLRFGIPWRALPRGFPPWQAVYRWFRALVASYAFERVNHALVAADRVGGGREPSPTAAVMDSETVKATEAPASRGHDGGKKINR